jgi:hypothetical protein
MDTVTGQFAKVIRKSEETFEFNLPIHREADAQMNRQDEPCNGAKSTRGGDMGADIRHQGISCPVYQAELRTLPPTRRPKEIIAE